MQLVKSDSDFLNTVSRDVLLGDDVLDVISGMKSLMVKCGGIGLAANQVGLLCRIIVLNVSGANGFCGEIINPVITRSTETLKISKEGCLSFPKKTAAKQRNYKITVEGFDGNWNPIKINASGLLSYCLQHEIDHLNGVVI